MKKNFVLACCALLLLCGLASCGGSGDEPSEPEEPSGVFVYGVEEGLKDGCGFYLVKNKESGAAAKYMLLKEDASGNISYCNQWATASNGKASLFVDNVKKEYDVAANTFAGKACTEVADAVLTLDGDGNPQKLKVGEGAEKTIKAYNGMVFDKFHVEGETDMQPIAVVWDMKTDKYAAITMSDYSADSDYVFSDDFYPYPMYDAEGFAFKPIEKASDKYGDYAGSNGALVFSSEYDDTMTETFFFIDSHETVVFNTTGGTTTVSQETVCDGMTEAALEYVESLDGILKGATLPDGTIVHVAETKTVGVFSFEAGEGAESASGCLVRYGSEGGYRYTFCLSFPGEGYATDGDNKFKIADGDSEDDIDGIIPDVGYGFSFDSNTSELDNGDELNFTCVFKDATYVAPYGNDVAIDTEDPNRDYDLYLNVFNDMMKIVGIDGRIISFYERTCP